MKQPNLRQMRHTARTFMRFTRPMPFRLPHHWPVQNDILSICQHMGPGLAAFLLILGVVYLMFGYNIYKALIMLNAAVLGASDWLHPW